MKSNFVAQSKNNDVPVQQIHRKKQELGVPTYLPTYLVTEHEIASELTVNYGYVGHDLQVQLDK